VPSWKKYLALFPLAQDKPSHILTNEIIWSAERIIQLQKQITTTIMDTYFPDHILFSIPGIGKITVATIIGEIGGSVDRFPDAKHFVGYIGLYPVVYQSGKKWDENIAFKSIKKSNEMTIQNFPVVENDIIKTGRPTIDFSPRNTGLSPKGISGSTRLT